MPSASSQNPNSEPTADAAARPSPDQQLRQLVIDSAPRLFAIVRAHEGDDRTAPPGKPAGVVVAWGMSCDDGTTYVADLNGGLHMALQSPDHAAEFFNRGTGVTARLVWLRSSRAADLDEPDDTP